MAVDQRTESFLGRFTVPLKWVTGALKGVMRELWITFAVKLLAVAAYQVMNFTIVLWLSSDLGYSDEKAFALVAAWSMLMTVFTLLVGSLTDAIGLRKTFLLGVGVCLVARAVMTFTTVGWLALAGGLLPLALGEALGTPVLVAAVRRYSTTAQRSISFSVFYALMNAGFLVSYYAFDYVRDGLGEHGHLTLPLIGATLTTYQVLFLISLLLEASLVPILYFGVREGAEASDDGVRIAPEKPRYPQRSIWNAFGLTVRDTLRETVRNLVTLARQEGFYRLLGFLMLMAFVKLIFMQMYYAYPKFGIRELGEGAPVGRLWALNSILIIVLVPIVGALSRKKSAYRMVTLGSVVSAASVFIMAMPPDLFQRLSDGRLGHLIANEWLGGYYKFTPDDFRDLPSLANKLQSTSDPVSRSLGELLSDTTRALLRREVAQAERGSGVARHPSSAVFAAEDIGDCDSLVARLQNDADATTRPVSEYVWSQVSAKNQRTLTVGDRPVPARKAVLVEELNRILQAGSLHEKQEQIFAGVVLSEGVRSLLRQDSKDREALPNLSLLQNRLLLEDTYPQEIAKSDHPLRAALTKDLNRIIVKEGSLREKSGFAMIPPSRETQEYIASKPQGKPLIRLNRLLLEDAFPNEVAKNRVGVPGSVSPWYVVIFLYVIVLSLGEAIYSPRLYEYAASIAPKGQEASYGALSYVPFLLAKLLVGTVSGVLLARYCPEWGPRDSQTMWLIIALITTICPVGLITLRRWIRVREAGRES